MGKIRKQYYYINSIGEITLCSDNGSYEDQLRKLRRNYFTTEDTARQAQKEYFKVLGTPTNILSNLKIKNLLNKLI